MSNPLQIGGISVLPQSLWVLGSTFILLIFLYLLSHRTLLGKAMEASSTDPLGADLLGISRNLMVFFAFGVSAGVGCDCWNSDHPDLLYQLQFWDTSGPQGFYRSRLGRLG